MLIAVAESVEEAKEIARTAPCYGHAEYKLDRDDTSRTLGEPTRILDIPCAEWHEWEE
jgi:hypothetical protein